MIVELWGFLFTGSEKDIAGLNRKDSQADRERKIV